MSESYERERQNNSRLDELAGKVSALRGVTIDIYDNARDQGVIDSSVRPPHPTTSIPHSLTAAPAERSLQQLQHLAKGQCWPSGKNGAAGKQGRHFQTRGHLVRHGYCALVDCGVGVWRVV